MFSFAPLPRRMRVAEIRRTPVATVHFAGAGHLDALVPGQRAAQVLGQLLDIGRQAGGEPPAGRPQGTWTSLPCHAFGGSLAATVRDGPAGFSGAVWG
jgi:hypothetical protein